MRYAFWLLAAGLALMGCQKETESPTTGVLHFACAETAVPVVQKEAAEFMRLYTKANITFDSTTTREALVKISNKETPLVLISRNLNQGEKDAFAAARMAVDTFALAKDGIAVIVHPDNAVGALNVEQLRDIYTGKISRWDAVGGRGGKIVPVCMSRNSGTTESFFREVGLDSTVAPGTHLLETSRQMVEWVAAHRDAVGFVGMNWLGDGVKAVAVAPGATKQYVNLNQASVYRGEYPLVTTFYALSTSGAYGLASGFIAFLTSAPGQKIFLNAGLVPVTMPVRLIQIGQPAQG
jgi:phosphate transport system substrate-binding protein